MKFLQMGGYAMYVWSAYGTAAVILIGNVLISIKARRKAIKTLQKNR